MVTIGIIVEYNPFHNGHLYHLKKIKEKYPESLIIAVISSSFTQRGEPSIINKWDKTKICLEAGIDIVVELPFIFATQAADVFASRAIELLKELKVDKIIFGSESNDVAFLESKAKEIIEFEKNISCDDKSISYSKLLGDKFKIKDSNDILGICYLKAVIKQKAKIDVETIKRTNDFNSLDLKDDIVSASAIRKALNEGKDVKKYVPSYTARILKNNISIDSCFNILKYKILTEDLSKYATVDEGMNERLKKYILVSNNMDELISNLMTKRYTKTKTQRMIIHIICNLTKKDLVKYKHNTYIRILGFSNFGQQYLNSIKKDLNIPLLTRFEKNNDILNIEYLSTKVYAFLSNDDNLINCEYKNKIIRI